MSSSMEPGCPTSTEGNNDTVLSSLEMFHIGTNDRPPSSSSSQSSNSIVSPFSPFLTNETSTSSPGSGTSSQTYSASGGISTNSTVTSPAKEPKTSTQSLLKTAKLLCSICGDISTGKHYTVQSCDGCKGFFKRVVRKQLNYKCLNDNKCVIDIQKRNRCPGCRYQKCLMMGMKSNNVQERRGRIRKNECVPVPTPQVKTLLELMMGAEQRLEEPYLIIYNNNTLSATELRLVAEKEMFQLFEWAKHVPHFNTFSLNDRMLLLRARWNELLILNIVYRSMRVEHALVFANGLTVNIVSSELVGLNHSFNFILRFIVDNFRCKQVDKAELACLKSIILFNPVSVKLSGDCIPQVESVRDNVFAILEEHTQSYYPKEDLRYAKLLVKLADIRLTGVGCKERLFFDRVIGGNMEDYMRKRLETSVNI